MGVESRYGLKFGYMDHGPRNLITDVPGVRVGHVTLHDGEVHTGVTAIIPHTGDVFHEKCLAGAHVINGFGKSIGLVQVQELGTLETPILLTNTLSVGTVSTALVEYMLERNDDIGLDAGTRFKAYVDGIHPKSQTYEAMGSYAAPLIWKWLKDENAD